MGKSSDMIKMEYKNIKKLLKTINGKIDGSEMIKTKNAFLMPLGNGYSIQIENSSNYLKSSIFFT